MQGPWIFLVTRHRSNHTAQVDARPALVHLSVPRYIGFLTTAPYYATGALGGGLTCGTTQLTCRRTGCAATLNTEDQRLLFTRAHENDHTLPTA